MPSSGGAMRTLKSTSAVSPGYRPGRPRSPMGLLAAVAGVALTAFVGCATGPGVPSGDLERTSGGQGQTPLYRIGPGDQLNVFVWDNPELSVSVPVRPDGRINTPLVEDLEAAGKAPTELARALEDELSSYIQNPVVTVMVTGFVGEFDQQVRVVGEATEPQALSYRDDMTLLDVMIAVGGLTEFAAGNDAKLIRRVEGELRSQDVRLGDLLRDGEISANVRMQPGDILIIPEAWF